MFMLQLEDTNDSTPGSLVTAANPIYLELDSTDPEPAPSSTVKVYLSLPSPYVCLRDQAGTTGGAVVSFQGTTANFWEITTDNPAIVTIPIWKTEIRVDVQNNIPTPFWIRSRTVFNEVPRDDRSVALKVQGKVEKA